ncbi:MAG: flagellar motor protein MotB [Pseudorhodobacter sp.]|nr:flagellar motor protein MotB [Pseudorhodobacter sp.]
MAGQSNAAPVIIKRKKIIKGGGHHGGAWKVAYADFVTAMMAFFLLMWLIGATSEKQRKGLADYFSPSIPISRISGGGNGAFDGSSVFSEDGLAQDGIGASSRSATESNQARGTTGVDRTKTTEQAVVEKALAALGGESMTMERVLRHVVTRVTDEGLVIEIFDLPEAPLFVESTAEPQPILRDVAAMLAEVLALATNSLAVNGHVKSYPIMLIDNPVWDLSAARAQAMRDLVTTAGLPGERVQRITGYADRKPVTADPMAPRNNRLEIILLRRDR